MDNQVFSYSKNPKVEVAEERISDILSEAIFCYITRKGLLKNGPEQRMGLQNGSNGLNSSEKVAE